MLNLNNLTMAIYLQGQAERIFVKARTEHEKFMLVSILRNVNIIPFPSHDLCHPFEEGNRITEPLACCATP